MRGGVAPQLLERESAAGGTALPCSDARCAVELSEIAIERTEGQVSGFACDLEHEAVRKRGLTSASMMMRGAGRGR